MLAFNLQLRQLVAPVTGTARWVGSTTAESLRRAQEARPADAKDAATNGTAKAQARRPRSRSPSRSRRARRRGARSILDEPAPRPASRR